MERAHATDDGEASEEIIGEPDAVVTRGTFDGVVFVMTRSNIYTFSRSIMSHLPRPLRLGFFAMLVALVPAVVTYWHNGGQVPAINNIEGVMQRLGLPFTMLEGEWRVLRENAWVQLAMNSLRHGIRYVSSLLHIFAVACCHTLVLCARRRRRPRAPWPHVANNAAATHCHPLLAHRAHTPGRPDAFPTTCASELQVSPKFYAV